MANSLFQPHAWKSDYQVAMREYGADVESSKLKVAIASCRKRLKHCELDCGTAEYQACLTALMDLLVLRLLQNKKAWGVAETA